MLSSQVSKGHCEFLPAHSNATNYGTSTIQPKWPRSRGRRCLTRSPLVQPQYQAPAISSFPVNTAAPRQLSLDGSAKGHGLAHKHTGKGKHVSTVRAPNRGGGDHRESFSSGPGSSDHHDAQPVWCPSPPSNRDQFSSFRDGGGGGGRGGESGGVGDMKQSVK